MDTPISLSDPRLNRDNTGMIIGAANTHPCRPFTRRVPTSHAQRLEFLEQQENCLKKFDGTR